MTAKEIRDIALHLDETLLSIEGQRVFMMLQSAQLLREIAAQLAELNQHLRKGVTSIETHSLEGNPL